MRRAPVALALVLAAVPIAVPAAEEDGGSTCLARAVYFEALAEGREGMEAVAAVVLNRMAHEEFPETACAVVEDGGETPPCQFSYWCDGKSDEPEDAEAWALAREVADTALADPPPDPTGGALFFHRTDVDPPFEEPREPTVTIGDHVFYR